MRFKIDWASLINRRKFTVFALFYFVFEGNFQLQAPGGLIIGGAILQRVFCVTSLGGLYLEGLIHGGAYFRNFTVCYTKFLLALFLFRLTLTTKACYSLQTLDVGVSQQRAGIECIQLFRERLSEKCAPESPER